MNTQFDDPKDEEVKEEEPQVPPAEGGPGQDQPPGSQPGKP